MDLILSSCPLFVLLVLLVLFVLFVWLLAVVIRALKRRALLKPTLLWAGIVMLVAVAVLYVGHCTGVLGDVPLLHYVFQCSCPQSMENVRIQRLYSEHAEILFPACGPKIGPSPSPDGEKIAVINFEKPDESYVWFLQTDERMPFTFGYDVIWLSDDLLFLRGGGLPIRVVDLVARTEIAITVRTDVFLADGEIKPSVLSALQEASYVILGGSVAAISPDALASPEYSFVVLRDEFASILADSKTGYVSDERMRQFLRDQGIDYLDYIDKRGTDVVLADRFQKYGIDLHDDVPYGDLVSPDGCFFYRESFYDRSEDGICLVETGEKIVDHIPRWVPIDWVHDGVIIRTGSDWLISLFPDVAPINQGKIRYPWLKLRLPAEYGAAGTGSD
jgi:hypothetical protein